MINRRLFTAALVLVVLALSSCGKNFIILRRLKDTTSPINPNDPSDDVDRTVCETLSNTLSWAPYPDPDLDLGGFRIYKKYVDGTDPLIYELRDPAATSFNMLNTGLDSCEANTIYIRAFTIYTASEGSEAIGDFRPEGSVKQESKMSNAVCWGVTCPGIQAVTTEESISGSDKSIVLELIE
ncbi:MAG: hypothetical protein A2504_09315 [Bdellovibrionales bacterium RIFOXYD12_FULL_39_22]|nr:MAG: hypothetical protein A2385_17235 [Bdellovibrionales bacterium RIFOXYB1_FULL_39_21]OFZ41061.1 MAG: hypothetical protein A2485_00160 [Bdellovibrionales bacterium RIFOXYC12_FULL_39_17]OFZ50274.1 MAG: hypothetical protein A2404_07475 [Bdellovibrionales bacterium RIFOXYC1_FULL_39_130]OFZ75075.1 MAG: hypothetical protein A2560_16170 [Bdellovibrionales bacterium RIFOXYD1_FULL_39_84]OFZ92283.1 MAG: hypothetical protein A2504_09315 [Bdellovibrionales bacterium RIFOXYD12_FULL_39_22]HLE10914.1 fi